ncbi:hypothetical protein MUU72_26445 [Streptomyces sp. RS10V-4]|uniref:hypothetical protein n=1 Tax=Streptomyces rhizoryzae TaxID=2932493 RepID=UPI002003013D|nr:hypothetical protein [Streptomyces rhizoryzae]MCK7626598.1 hypothetical protein [Streptomyces rhizoryzae]
MNLRRGTVSGITSAVTLGTLAFLAPPTQAVPPPAAGTCAEAVRTARQHLASAGAPTNSNDWRSVRDAAQDFVNSHPHGGSGTEALKRDISELNRLCAP